MSFALAKQTLKALFTHYGMAAVLVLLCLFFSWITYQEQQPRGAEGARILLRQFKENLAAGANVLIVAKPTEEDAQFVATLEAGLKQAGFNVLKVARGTPRDARLALEELRARGLRIDAVATTPECAVWTVFENLGEKFPDLPVPPRVFFPRSYRWPTFLLTNNLLNVANQIAVVAILAVGMTFVIITGGIDLSVGSLIALAAVVTALLIRDLAGGAAAGAGAMVLCSLGGVLACALVGMFSGCMITAFKIPPFIATLAVMQVANGLAFILARGQSIYELPESFVWLGRGTGWFSLPHAVVLMAILYVAAHVLMSRTTLGRYIYAVGGNAEAARLSGVRVGTILVLVYTLSGALAGLGGVVMASQLKSGSPTYGLTYELYVIAAVVVGGASLSGGEGRIFGTLIGAFIIAVIQNGMNLTGVESYTQKIVLGLLILTAVLLDMLKKRGWREAWKRFRSLLGRAPAPPSS
jgi:ribose transport system permease protein